MASSQAVKRLNISIIPPHGKTAIIFWAVYHPSNAVKWIWQNTKLCCEDNRYLCIYNDHRSDPYIGQIMPTEYGQIPWDVHRTPGVTLLSMIMIFTSVTYLTLYDCNKCVIIRHFTDNVMLNCLPWSIYRDRLWSQIVNGCTLCSNTSGLKLLPKGWELDTMNISIICENMFTCMAH